MRNNSSGRINNLGINRSSRPEPSKTGIRRSSYMKFESPDFFKEFKNSLNCILNNYNGKKSMTKKEVHTSDRDEECGNKSSQQKKESITKKLLRKPSAQQIQTNLYTSKPKSKSASVLKPKQESFLEKQLKRVRNSSNSLVNKSYNKSSVSRILGRQSGSKSNQIQIEHVRRNSPSNSTVGSLLAGNRPYQRNSKALPTQSSNVGKIMSMYNSPQSLIAQKKKELKPKSKEYSKNVLSQFVTSVAEGHDSIKIPVRSHSVIQKPKTSDIGNKKYFFDDLVKAHVQNDPHDYFHSLLKTYMTQTLQSIMILSKVDVSNSQPNGKLIEIERHNSSFKLRARDNSRPVSPPSAHSKKTIIFDLDETLIHCNEDQNGPCDVRIPVTFPSGEKIMAGINIRPYAKEILEELAPYFEVIVFTASHSCYANPVIDHLDKNRVISARLFRENCSQIANGLFTKDLRVIKNRELRDLVLVDNAVYSFILNLENGIPIIPYYDNIKDNELVKLKDFLLQLKNVEDVRPFILKYFEWETFLKHGAEPEKLFKKLFNN